MLSCAEFIGEYSDFRDGLMDEERSTLLADHLERCPSCARYDRVLNGGIRELLELPDVEPSCDFVPRLQHRLYHLDDDIAMPARASGASVGFVMLLVAAIAVGAWLPMLDARPAVLELPPVVASAPRVSPPLPALFRTAPLLDPSSPGLRPGLESNQLFFQYARLGATPTVRTTIVAAGPR